MKLWLIIQRENNDYDTYDEAVVAAETDEEARHMNPENGCRMDWANVSARAYKGCWCTSPDAVLVRYLGEAKEGTEAGVISASFNAG